MSVNRNTVQREIVYQHLAHMCGHFTADELYEKIHKNYPGISKATVYRNLKTLTAQGRILHIAVPDGADRYEKLVKKHYHVKCIYCGRISDVSLPFMESLTEEAQKLESDCRIVGYSLIFDGVCSECAESVEDN